MTFLSPRSVHTLWVAAVLSSPALAQSTLSASIERKFAQPILDTTRTVTMERAFPGAFRETDARHVGAVVLLEDGSQSPARVVYHMDQIGKWNAVYPIDLQGRAVVDLAVLRNAGPSGRDAVALLMSTGVEVYGVPAVGGDFVLQATHSSWAGLAKLWACEDDSGADELFALNDATGYMHRANFDGATNTFTEGLAFRCPTTTSDLLRMEYSVQDAGREIVLNSGVGQAYVLPPSGIGPIAFLNPGSPSGGESMAVIKGNPAEGDFLAWRHTNASQVSVVRIFNHHNSTEEISLGVGTNALLLTSMAGCDWLGSGEDQLLVAGKKTDILNPAPTVRLWERMPDKAHGTAGHDLQFDCPINDAAGEPLVYNASGASDVYHPSPLTAMVVTDADDDGDVDLYGLSGLQALTQVFDNNQVSGRRPISFINKGTTNVESSANGQSVGVSQLVWTQMPSDFAQMTSATHVRFRVFIRGEEGLPCEMDDMFELFQVIPAGATANNFIPSKPVTLVFDTPPGYDSDNFQLVYQVGLVELDASGSLVEAMPTSTFTYSRGNAGRLLEHADGNLEIFGDPDHSLPAGGSDGDHSSGGERPGSDSGQPNP